MTFYTEVYCYKKININSVNENILNLIRKRILVDIEELIKLKIKEKLSENINTMFSECFVCKSKIKINILNNILTGDRIDKKEFLCKDHRDYKINKESISFFRHEHIFYKKLKDQINNEGT